MTGHSRALPDPGWAENEVRRIKAAKGSTAWVLTDHPGSAWVDQLLAEIGRAGGTVVEERVQDRWLRQYPSGMGDLERAAAFLVAFQNSPVADPCRSESR